MIAIHNSHVESKATARAGRSAALRARERRLFTCSYSPPPSYGEVAESALLQRLAGGGKATAKSNL